VGLYPPGGQELLSAIGFHNQAYRLLKRLFAEGDPLSAFSLGYLSFGSCRKKRMQSFCKPLFMNALHQETYPLPTARRSLVAACLASLSCVASQAPFDGFFAERGVAKTCRSVYATTVLLAAVGAAFGERGPRHPRNPCDLLAHCPQWQCLDRSNHEDVEETVCWRVELGYHG
jgi:hypothetical protein